MTTKARREITREIAAFAVHCTYDSLPDTVKREAPRAFLNWMGCALGGCREASVEAALPAILDAGGHPQSSVLGRRLRTDMASAAFLNCLSSSALAYDDTHLDTVTHPTGPVAAGIFALSERQTVPGEAFASALALGIEIECRLSNVLLMPPAQANLGMYVTGVTGPVGGAVALGRLLGFNEQQMTSAIGLAAAQASGSRATHGSMAAFGVPAFAARSGVTAAILASKGFTCSGGTLESEKGFVEMFSRGADLDAAVRGLGQQFEMLRNAYKPYPCGIVIHGAIDACLEVAQQLDAAAVIESVRMTVHPLTLMLADRPDPVTLLEAQVSLYHCTASSFLHRTFGLAELDQGCIEDPAIAALRRRITATTDASFRRDEAKVEVTLADGRVVRAHVAIARGSTERPMPDEDLDSKFRVQARRELPEAGTERLLQLCRDLAGLSDVGARLSGVLAS